MGNLSFEKQQKVNAALLKLIGAQPGLFGPDDAAAERTFRVFPVLQPLEPHALLDRLIELRRNYEGPDS